jgi:hypothetical protein
MLQCNVHRFSSGDGTEALHKLDVHKYAGCGHNFASRQGEILKAARSIA